MRGKSGIVSVVLVASLSLAGAACGDDGADVRKIGEDGTRTATATGTGTGTATRTGTATPTGAETPTSPATPSP